jgi:hypothetical protein
MSIRSQSGKAPQPSGNRDAYRDTFLIDAHRLLVLGYARMRPEERQMTEEEIITEDLVKAINELIEGSEGKRWMQRYIAADNHPVGSPNRKGKRRPRVDIEIVQLQGRRPRFHFESKRLGKSPHTVGKYLGKDGLGCFLEAQYARDSDQGGMLGYVQAGSCEKWARRIENSLLKNPQRHGMLLSTGWEPCRIIDELQYTYRTQHKRPSLGRPIRVYHTLLLFYDPGLS